MMKISRRIPRSSISVCLLFIFGDDGVLLGLATGRELNDRLYNQGADWGLDYPFDFLIGMNGGQICDLNHKCDWTMDLMSRETMKDILTYMMPLIEKYEVSENPISSEISLTVISVSLSIFFASSILNSVR